MKGNELLHGQMAVIVNTKTEFDGEVVRCLVHKEEKLLLSVSTESYWTNGGGHLDVEPIEEGSSIVLHYQGTKNSTYARGHNPIYRGYVIPKT